MAVFSGQAKRRLAEPILRVGVDLARSEKQPNDCFMAVRGTPAKRRPAVAILRVGVDLVCGE